MSDQNAALAEAAQTVTEPAVAEVAQVVNQEIDRAELFEQYATARMAQDHTETSRLEGLLGEIAKGAPAEVKEEPKVEAKEEVPEKVEIPVKVEEEEDDIDIDPEPPSETPAAKEKDRFRFKDPEDRAIAAMAKSQGIPLAEAARIRSEIVAKGKPAEQEQVQPQTQVADPAITALESEVAAIEQRLDEISEGEGFFTKDVAALTKQLSKANAKLEATRSATKTIADVRAISEQERAKQSAASNQQQWEASSVEAAKAFPAWRDKSSALFLAAKGLASEISSDTNHPDYVELTKPTAPVWLANKVAALLKIAPADAAPKEVAPVVPAKVEEVVARPAPGSRGSAPAAPAPTAQERIDAATARALRAITGGGKARGSSDLIIN